MTYTYSITKTPTGYAWAVEEVTPRSIAIVKQGRAPSRLRAAAACKRWIRYFKPAEVA